MQPRRAGLLRQITASESASAALEFALIGPAFLGLMLAIINTALIFLAQESLETAAESAARLLLTGQAQTFQTYQGQTKITGMTGDQFKAAICGTLQYNPQPVGYPSATYGNGSMLPPFLSCDDLYVNVAPATDFNTANISTPNLTVNSAGQIVGTSFSTSTGSSSQGQILVVQLLYLWPTYTGPLGLNLSNTPALNRVLVATEVIRTESFPCPTGVSQC